MAWQFQSLVLHASEIVNVQHRIVSGTAKALGPGHFGIVLGQLWDNFEAVLGSPGAAMAAGGRWLVESKSRQQITEETVA